MNENREKEAFNYTYSAKEQKEIEDIRKKYLPTEGYDNKLETLRRLDAGVRRTAMAWSLVLGVLGVLILGSGMSLIMTDIGEFFGIVGVTGYIVGICVGAFGAIMAGIAYPVYSAMIKKKRAKIAPEIIRLTDELLKK